jgi:hypothetical protein
MTESEWRKFGEAADELEQAASGAKACKAVERFKAHARLRIARKQLRHVVNGLLVDAYTEGSERALSK